MDDHHAGIRCAKNDIVQTKTQAFTGANKFKSG